MFRLPLLHISLLFALVVAPMSARLHAQQTSQHTEVSPRLDLAVTYATEYTKKANTTQSVWLQGGSVQIGTNVYRGLGIAADFTGLHSSSVGSSGVPFSEITVTFGPRYRVSIKKKISIYGQGLIGEGDAFDSVFPGTGATQSGVNSRAVNVGGGIDYRLNERFAVRAIDASWIRTQYLNSTNNQQNDLRLGAVFMVLCGR